MNRTLFPPETGGFNSARLERIKPAMQSYVDQKGYAGLSTLLARRGRIIHNEQVGWQDRESQTPLSADTIYRIYSMTKPIICTALMTLYEDGRFQLFDPVAKYLPAFSKVRVMRGVPPNETADTHHPLVDPIRPISIRDLLTHTSGLTYNFLVDSPVSELYRQANFMKDSNVTLEAVIDELARLPLAYQPGTRWHYSMGIDVAAHLIQVLSGQRLQDFLKERLFDPLGMVDTAFHVPPEKLARLSNVYGLPDVATHNVAEIFIAWQMGFNERVDVEATHPSGNTTTFARGGHGLFSTAYDYLRFAQMLLQRGELDGVRILGPKTVSLMHSNHLPPALLPIEIGGVASPGYGFGLGSSVLLDVAQAAMPGSVGKFGWGGAANTEFWVDPLEEIVGVFMSQYMMSFETPQTYFQTLVYTALMD